jgi:hypothetical protein
MYNEIRISFFSILFYFESFEYKTFLKKSEEHADLEVKA